MQNILVLTAIAVLANNTAAIAEDNGALLKAAYHGSVTGEEEKDTFGYNPNIPSDLQFRFRTVCALGRSCTDLITTGSVSKTQTAARSGIYYGSVTGNDEKDTFAF